MKDCPLCARLAGPDDSRVARLDQCDVFLGENQGCPGWCVLVLRGHVEHMADLPMERQSRVFSEVARVAGAIRRVYPRSGVGGRPPRINYECLGNQQPHVHWHVIPRHADDPEPRQAVWGWDWNVLRGDMSAAARATLAGALAEAVRSSGDGAG